MRIVINIILFLAVVGLSYLLYDSIATPIQFREAWKERESKVASKLDKIRKAQIAYKSIKDEYAPTFDELENVLSTDSFKLVAVVGDPDDPNAKIQYITTFVNAKDSMQRVGIDVEELRYVPYTDNQEEFTMEAKVLPEYQKVKDVPVVQAGVRIRDYMGQWGNKKYAMYDPQYNPDALTKFGSLTAPTTDGNWRK